MILNALVDIIRDAQSSDEQDLGGQGMFNIRSIRLQPWPATQLWDRRSGERSAALSAFNPVASNLKLIPRESINTALGKEAPAMAKQEPRGHKVVD